MISIIRLSIIACLVLLSSACNPVNPPPESEVRLAGETMGTTYSITYVHPEGTDFKTSIDSLLAAFNMSVSTYIPESIISRVNASSDTTTGTAVDTHFANIVAVSRTIFSVSDGAFDPTVMPLVNAWGFGPERRREIEQPLLDSLLQLVDFNAIDIREEILFKKKPFVQLDFSAIAKGYGVDLVGDFLRSHSVDQYFVEIGGEVRTLGMSPDGDPWVVGIEKPDPNSFRDIEETTMLFDEAMATSGNYRNFIEIDGVMYGHEIDPATGRPAMNTLLSVSVKAPDCATADAYATAFMVLGLDRSREIVEADQSLEALFIFSDEDGNYSIEQSTGFTREWEQPE